MSNIKILGVMDEEPFDYKTWSGSSRYFFSALREKGVLYDAIHTEPPRLTSTLFKLMSFYPDLEIWKRKYHMNTRYFQRRTRIALDKMGKLDSNGFNVVLQVGAWCDLPGKTDKITVSYHDGNLAGYLRSGRNRRYSKFEFVKNCLAHEKALYDRMDMIFPMSRWLGDSFAKDFGVPGDKVVPVGAGINLPRVKEIVNKSYEEPNILFVGKMFERKGGHHLLEAFKRVRREIPGARLTIIGPELKDLPEGVTCLGFVSKSSESGVERLLEEYSKASLFVMPSLFEPFGIVFAEAMAHKLPCIGTDTCAMPEIIKDGESGYITPVGESRVLARRIVDLLKDPAAAEEMGGRGYDRYREHFTWERVADKIRSHIESKFF